MRNKKFHSILPAQRHVTACLCVIATLLTVAGCRRAEEVRFKRLEQLLFDTPANQLQQVLLQHRDEYDTELIAFQPDDDGYISMTKEFTSDPVIRDVYRVTDSLYHDLSDVERELGKALANAYRLCPQMRHVEGFYTMVTGDYDNYHYRVFSDCKDLCVAIDQYALGNLQRYNSFGMPNYLVSTFTREQIVPDCMRTLANLYTDKPEGERTLLDHMVFEGKIMCFVEKTMPWTDATTLLRYTDAQYDWMRKNEKNVWSWLIQNKMLYSTDQAAFRNLVGDAPHTNAFGAESAPRTTGYIGWQIVRSYLKHSGVPMQELLADTDSQKILAESGWRP